MTTTDPSPVSDAVTAGTHATESARSGASSLRAVEGLHLDAGVREVPGVVRARDRRDGEAVLVSGHEPDRTRGVACDG